MAHAAVSGAPRLIIDADLAGRHTLTAPAAGKLRAPWRVISVDDRQGRDVPARRQARLYGTAEGVNPMAQPLTTMYTTTWCAFCKRLKSQLARDGIEISEVNIEEHPEAAEYVMSVNGGNQTVPTVVFADGSAMTNPSAAQVKQRLQELSAVK
jgi:mycoredoxin